VLASRLRWLLKISGSFVLVVEFAPGGVDSTCHPPEVDEMSTSVLEIEGTAVCSEDDATSSQRRSYVGPGGDTNASQSLALAE